MRLSLKSLSFAALFVTLAGCAGSPARMAMQSEGDIYKYIQESKQPLCSHYRTALGRFAKDFSENGKVYMKVLKRIANETDTNLYACDTGISKNKDFVQQFKMAAVFLVACRRDYALPPLQRLPSSTDVSLKDLDKTGSSERTKAIASAVFDRLKICQKQYTEYSGIGGKFGVFMTEIKQEEQEALLAAYRGEISGTALREKFDSINNRVVAAIKGDAVSINRMTATAQAAAAAQQAAKRAEQQKIYDAADKAVADFGKNAFKDESDTTTLRCSPSGASLGGVGGVRVQCTDAGL